jgi:hypothetical protein
MIPSLIIYVLLDPFYHFFATDRMMSEVQQKLGVRGFILVLVVIAPWVETFIGQGLPWLLTRLLRLPSTIFLVVATIWFATLHGWGFNGPDFWIMVLAHIVPAFLLAFTFLQGEKRSDWRAIWMTATVHMVANGVVAVAGAIASLAKHAIT